jgi:hypothetical protein
MFLGFNAGFFPMHIAGLLGMPRRIYTYPGGLGWDLPNLITTIGAYVFALGVLLFLVNVVWSLRRGARAGSNPWDAPTLEWSVPSPVPPYNFAVIPTVRSRYPLWEEQLQAPERSTLHEGLVLDNGRETVATSPLDAEPETVLRMESDSILPLSLALGLTAVTYGLLIRSLIMVAAGMTISIACLVGWLWPARAEEEPA